MKPKLACADFTFPLLAHDKVLDLIAMLELKGVDIGLFEGRSHLWPSREFKNLRRAARSLKKKLGDRGLVAADIFMQVGEDFAEYAVNHPQTARRRKARDWFGKTLEYAAAVGASHVTGLPGVLFAEESRAGSWNRAIDELAWRVEQARAHKLVYGVEAHIGSLAPRPKTAARLIGDVPGLTLTLDYTHFTKIGLPDGEIEPLVQHASHFHVRGGRKGRLQQYHRLPTRGQGDAKDRLSRLARHRIRVDRLGALQRVRQFIGDGTLPRLLAGIDPLTRGDRR